MKNLLILSLIVLLTSCNKTQPEEIKGDMLIIPRPTQISFFEGIFEMNDKTSIKVSQDLIPVAEQLRSFLCPASGYLLPVNKRKSGGNVILLELKEDPSLGHEGYEINISEKKVIITAQTKKGIFWGMQTLRQLFTEDILRKAEIPGRTWTLPCVKITDKPRFSWRGLMIDYSRTFWNKSVTERYIDAISYYKMNKIHMHLTDDQGWRLQIDSYPGLTGKASRFDTIYHEPGEREGYYTKEDIRELVKYAEARNVELIPEIEMPGHSLAILSAYPELSCTGEAHSIHPFFKGPGIHEDILCAGKEQTYEFIENVLDEVIELFPSEYVHIGGDEAPKAKWHSCPDCQKMIKEQGLKNEEDLQSYFIRRIEKHLNSKGKKLIGWDEITEGGLSTTATMMFWRGWAEDALLTAVNQGNDVIMTPTTHCYFDYTYETIPVEKVYSFEPLSGKFKDTDPKHFLGVQANFWSHIDRNEPGMDRQIFPRLIALAEVGWTDPGNKSLEDFSKRLNQHYKSLDLLDVYYMNR